jgi:TetR/AcrR family transcriptional regulator
MPSTPGTDFRRKRAARTRRRILDAGLRVFSKRGYERASMDDIALELEATKGLLYYYFRSKEELLKAVLQEHPLRIGIEILEREVPDGDLREALSDVALLSLREMREHRAFIRFLLLQAQCSPEQHELVFRELIDRWTRVFEAIIKRHLDDSSGVTAGYLATQLVDVLLSAFLRGELGGGSRRRDLEEYVLHAVQTVACRVEAVSGDQK